MSADDLDIRGGGAVAVDSGTLVEAAVHFGAVARELDDAALEIEQAAALVLEAQRDAPALFDGRARDALPLSDDLTRLARQIRDAAARADLLDHDLRHAAAVYEFVELSAARAAAAAAGNEIARAALDAGMAALRLSYPDAAVEAEGLAAAHALGWPGDLARQAGEAWAWAFGGSAAAAIGVYLVAQSARVLGAGTISRSTRLTINPSAVDVGVVRRGSSRAPASLSEAAERIPGGGDARVRVERYSMPDGTRQFVVYVAGTQSPLGMGGGDPFDALSNLQLYGGYESASYDAVSAALRTSGAQPGDVIHQVAHSQGAMITAHLAAESDYDTRTLISFGSPVEADLGDGVLSVSVRHTDDPVAALEGGGYAHAVGGSGSFVAEREADPVGRMGDLGVPAHMMSAYEETARMLDASPDPRMDAVRSMFAELDTATSVEAVDYSAVRIAPRAESTGSTPAPVPSDAEARRPSLLSSGDAAPRAAGGG